MDLQQNLVGKKGNFFAYEFFMPAKSGAITEHDLAKARLLCRNVLQPLRDFIGSPVVITSGKRSEAHNKKIGGARSSDHLYREGSVAADFTNRDVVKCFEYIMRNHMDVVGQLIIYPDRNFCHVSLSTPKHTRDILVCTDGKYVRYSRPEQLI